jgi:nickel-type superoxide dismutase maturation protease
MGLLDQPYPATRGRNRPGPAILFAAALAWALVWVRPFRVVVQGGSMLPTLQPGDFLLATRRGPFRNGSLVVAEHPGRPGYEMVKRIAAVPGEGVGDRTRARAKYRLLGDNPAGSTDSRTLGPMPRGSIRGVVRLRYWPPSRFRVFG